MDNFLNTAHRLAPHLAPATRLTVQHCTSPRPLRRHRPPPSAAGPAPSRRVEPRISWPAVPVFRPPRLYVCERLGWPETLRLPRATGRRGGMRVNAAVGGGGHGASA